MSTNICEQTQRIKLIKDKKTQDISIKKNPIKNVILESLQVKFHLLEIMAIKNLEMPPSGDIKRGTVNKM